MLISIIVSFLFVAFFAGIETAFISVNKLSIELKKKQGKPSGAILSRLWKNRCVFWAHAW